MKNIKKMFLSAVITFAIVFSLFGCGIGKTVDTNNGRASALSSESKSFTLENIEPLPDNAPELFAEQAFLYDVNAEKYIIKKGAGEMLYPASTTKLLTALVVLELLPTDFLITPGKEQALKNEASSVAFVKENHTLSVEMLIEGMLLPSGGDAAYALAAAGGYALGDKDISAEKAVELFIDEMNRYAKKLGMTSSNFASPDGFYDPQNYSTVEDMTLLTLAAAKNEIIMKYASLPTAAVTYASGHTNTWLNTNRMLHEDDEFYSPYVTGLKTGTLDGNSCLVCTFTIEEKEYVAGVFTEKEKEDRYIDMSAIVDFCEKNG